MLILCNLINKEQGKNLYAFVEQFSFSLDVRKDSLANLDTAKLVFADLTDNITCINLDAVDEFHGVITTVNGLNNETVLVFIQITGIIVKVESDADLHRLLTDTGCTLEIKLQCSSGVCFGKIEPFQIHITFGSSTSCFGDALNSNLFNKSLIVCLHSIQTVNHIIDTIGFMGSRITKCHQRLELFESLFCLLPLNGLRFINDNDRVCLGYNINRSARTELVQFHINSSGIFATRIECLRVDDHNID